MENLHSEWDELLIQSSHVLFKLMLQSDTYQWAENIIQVSHWLHQSLYVSLVQRFQSFSTQKNVNYNFWLGIHQALTRLTWPTQSTASEICFINMWQSPRCTVALSNAVPRFWFRFHRVINLYSFTSVVQLGTFKQWHLCHQCLT